jgi:hypothetical protein
VPVSGTGHFQFGLAGSMPALDCRNWLDFAGIFFSL